MGEHIFDIVRGFFTVHGYWTLALALLLENTGLPVPGETVLLFASFLAYSQHELRLPFIIVTAIAAATLGDNIGYLIGRRGGRPLLDRYQHVFRISRKHVLRGERLFAKYGAVTVFFARFVFGMRVLAGPLAGVLKMPRRKFMIFNLLGAASWVTVISCVGYLFGSKWRQLLSALRGFNLAVAAIAALVIGFFWWRRRQPGVAEE